MEEKVNRAVVWKGPGKIEIEERAIGTPGAGEVLLKIKTAGICGTDFHILAGRHPEARPPLVVGHEFCGEIIDTGTGVPPSALGKRVISDSYIGCGSCRFCLTGKKQLCEKGTKELGVNEDGGWQNYIVVPYENLFELPENLSYAEAGAGCLLTCPPAAIERVNVRPGETLLILGDGPSSLVMLQLARLKGAGRIILSGHRKKRLDTAKKLGCDVVLNAHETDVEKWIEKSGDSPQIVIDAIGTSESFTLALKTADREGRVHLFGLPEALLEHVPMDMVLWKELTITSSTGAPGYWPTALDLISRKLLSIEPLISHAFPLESASSALEFMQEHPGEIIKALFMTEEQ
jgi:threonine dehydrogenase-like Zn-dependent dehydrogenase